MKQFSQEDLIGYLLGAHEPQLEKSIQLALSNDLALRERLADVEEMLTKLPDRFVEIDPPEGLAEKTLNTIAIVDHATGDELLNPHETKITPKASATSPSAKGHSAKLSPSKEDRQFSNRSWSVMDLMVGCSVCLVIAIVLLPSIANSRFESKKILCQENLRTIGYNLASIAESYEGQIHVSPNGKQWEASQFIQRIIDAELVQDTGGFICPSDPGAEQTARFCSDIWDMVFQQSTPMSPVTATGASDLFEPVENTADVSNDPQFPSSVELAPSILALNENSPANDFGFTSPINASNRSSEAACGSYGFAAPRIDDTTGMMCSIRIPSSSNEVLCADSACFDNPGFRSRNHLGRGQNVLLGDLSVSYIENTACIPSGDHIYTNSLGKVQPGFIPGDNLIIRGMISY